MPLATNAATNAAHVATRRQPLLRPGPLANCRHEQQQPSRSSASLLQLHHPAPTPALVKAPSTTVPAIKRHRLSNYGEEGGWVYLSGEVDAAAPDAAANKPWSFWPLF